MFEIIAYFVAKVTKLISFHSSYNLDIIFFLLGFLLKVSEIENRRQTTATECDIRVTSTRKHRARARALAECFFTRHSVLRKT